MSSHIHSRTACELDLVAVIPDLVKELEPRCLPGGGGSPHPGAKGEPPRPTAPWGPRGERGSRQVGRPPRPSLPSPTLEQKPMVLGGGDITVNTARCDFSPTLGSRPGLSPGWEQSPGASDGATQ